MYRTKKNHRDASVKSGISFCRVVYMLNIKRRVSDLPTYPRSLECHRSCRGATYTYNIVLHRGFLTGSIGK